MLTHSGIVLQTVFRANKIPLRPKGVISLSQSENNTLCVSTEYNLFFCCKRVWVSPKKAAFVLTNAMPVLSNKHIKNLDEFHRGFNHPYDK